MNAEILAVGTELLHGDIVNTNAQYISREFAKIGIDVHFHTVVGDNAKRMKMAFETKTFKPREFKVTKAAALDYEVGDTVRHIKFGVGIVKDIVDGGRDYEVTVDFDKVGIKKMFAGFAKLKKL